MRSADELIIKVQTADKWYAGTDDDVEVSMSGTVSGETNHTGKLPLDEKNRNDHEKGDMNVFWFDQCPVGNLKLRSGSDLIERKTSIIKYSLNKSRK